MKTAYAALAKAQAKMGPALKSATNPHLKRKYADLGAVQEACFDALRDNGFAVLQPVGQDESGTFVKTVFAHESGEVLECTVPLLIAKNDMQGLGSAITYARRYGLMAMAGIAPEDDDGRGAADSVKSEREAKAAADQAALAAEKEAAATESAEAIIAKLQTLSGAAAGAFIQEKKAIIARLDAAYPAHFKRIETAAANAGAPIKQAS